MVLPTPTHPITTDLDDDLETLSFLVTKTRGDKRMRAEVRALMVSTLTERLIGRDKGQPSHESRKKIGEFVDSFIVATDLRKDKQPFSQDRNLINKFQEILESIGIVRSELIKVVKQHLKDFAERCSDLVRGIIKEKEESKASPNNSRRRSEDTPVGGALAIPKLIGGTATPVSVLIAKQLETLLSSDKPAQDDSIQQVREHAIKKLFADPYKLPEAVKSSLQGLDTLSEAQYAVVYDRALYAAIEMRRDEDERIATKEREAQLRALASMRKDGLL